MGFNKKYVPEYDVLVREILTVDSSFVAERYSRADALIGSEKSIKLLDEFMKEYYEGNEVTVKRFVETLSENSI